MKRFALILALVLLLPAGASFAEDMSADWASTVKIGGYIDVRPVFYSFTPDKKYANPKAANDARDAFHYSDVSLYEAALTATAQPFEAVKGVATLYYGEGQQDFLGLGGTAANLDDNASGAVYFDEAYLQLGSGDSIWAKFGKYYMPLSTHDTFGFHYNLLQRNVFANPVAIGAGYNHRFVSVSAHLWNGAFDLTSSSGRTDNDIIDTYAFGLNFFPLAFQETHELNIGLYAVSDFAETWGGLGGVMDIRNAGTNSASDPGFHYNTNVPLYGGYLIGRFYLSDLIGLGLRGEYATTGVIEKDAYENAAGDETSISFMNAELALLFWEGVLKFGGKYESISGVNYFGTTAANYEPTSYTRGGGFLRSNLMEELSVGLEYLVGFNNESDTDSELQIQTRLDF
jgi:hypothetical protein